MAIAPETLAPQDAAQAATAPVDPYDLTNPETKAQALQLFKERFDKWNTPARTAQCRNSWRNLFFKRGWQWIVYDRGRATFRPISVKQYNGPRPVSPMYTANMNAFCAVLGRIEPTITFRPATEEPEDLATAEVSDRVIEVCVERVRGGALEARVASLVRTARRSGYRGLAGPSLAASTRPPCSSTRRRTRLNPTPRPPSWRSRFRSPWTNRSNTLGSSSSEMPEPWSATQRTAWSCSRETFTLIAPPFGVNFSEFEIRLASTWRMR